MSRFARPLITLTLIALTVLGLINTYSDHSAVLAQAEATACDGCEPHLVSINKTPISQTYALQVSPAVVEHVSCQREFLLLGEYSCEISSP